MGYPEARNKGMFCSGYPVKINLRVNLADLVSLSVGVVRTNATEEPGTKRRAKILP